MPCIGRGIMGWRLGRNVPGGWNPLPRWRFTPNRKRVFFQQFSFWTMDRLKPGLQPQSVRIEQGWSAGFSLSAGRQPLIIRISVQGGIYPSFGTVFASLTRTMSSRFLDSATGAPVCDSARPLQIPKRRAGNRRSAARAAWQSWLQCPDAPEGRSARIRGLTERAGERLMMKRTTV